MSSTTSTAPKKLRKKYTIRDFKNVYNGRLLDIRGFPRPCKFLEIDEETSDIFIEPDEDDVGNRWVAIARVLRIRPETIRYGGVGLEDSQEPKGSKQSATPKKLTKKKIRGTLWWKTEKRWYRVMTYEEVALWAYLHHKYERLKDQLADGKWMWATEKMVEQDLAMGRYTQERLIASLIEKGFLKTKLMSSGSGYPKRHFLLFTKRLNSAIQKSRSKAG